METLQGIRYNLRMMGVPIYGPSYIYVDNVSVIHNTQCPESTLKNNSKYILYYAVHESITIGDYLTVHVGTNKTTLTWLPRYCMVESAGFMRQSCYTHLL